jgi:hypothetical protein
MVSRLIFSMFPTKETQKCVIMELSRRVNINYLRPSAKKSKNKTKKTSSVHSTLEDEGLDYLSAPMYAAGRVIVASMLGKLLSF